MRPDLDAVLIAFAKDSSRRNPDKPVETVPLGDHDEVFVYQAGELVNYENTAAMRQER